MLFSSIVLWFCSARKSLNLWKDEEFKSPPHLHSRTHFITEIMHPQSYYSMLGLYFILENNQVQNLLTPLKNILTSWERSNGYTLTCPPANMTGSQWPCLSKWPRADAHSIDITDMLQQYPMSEHSWDRVRQSVAIMASSICSVDSQVWETWVSSLAVWVIPAHP